MGNLAGPAFKAYKANKAALKAAMKGGWAAKKLAFKSFFRTFAHALKNKMKKKLWKRMKHIAKGRENEILLGGAELLIEMQIARETDDAALKELAMDLATAVDPTGVMSVVASFQAPSCKDRAIAWMPAIQHRRLKGSNANSTEHATVPDFGDAPDVLADGDAPVDLADDVGGAENVEDTAGMDEADKAEIDDTGDLGTDDAALIEEPDDPDEVENDDIDDPENFDAAGKDEDAVWIGESDDADQADAGDGQTDDFGSNVDNFVGDDEITNVENLSNPGVLNASDVTGPERRLRGFYVV